jgi:hypothetical protein
MVDGLRQKRPVVTHHNHGHVLLGDVLLEMRTYAVLACLIDGRKGFVEQKESWPAQKGSTQGNSLAFTTTQVPWGTVEKLGDLEPLDNRVRVVNGAIVSNARKKVLVDRHVRKEVRFLHRQTNTSLLRRQT